MFVHPSRSFLASLPLPFSSPSFPLSFSLPLEVGPLIAARGSRDRFNPPPLQRGWAEPGRQTVFGEFQAKNLL